MSADAFFIFIIVWVAIVIVGVFVWHIFITAGRKTWEQESEGIDEDSKPPE